MLELAESFLYYMNLKEGGWFCTWYVLMVGIPQQVYVFDVRDYL